MRAMPAVVIAFPPSFCKITKSGNTPLQIRMSRDSGIQNRDTDSLSQIFSCYNIIAPIPNVLLNPLHIESFFTSKYSSEQKLFLQYFRPQLYSGGHGKPHFGTPQLHSGTRLAALWDTSGFIPGHGLPHFGTPRLHSRTGSLHFGTPPASFRDTACRTSGHPWLHSGTHCNPATQFLPEFSRPLPEIRSDPAGNTEDPTEDPQAICLQTARDSAPVRFYFVLKRISAASSITL